MEELSPVPFRLRTNPPMITETEFLSVIWAGTAISFGFLATRLFTRHTGPKGLHWDDLLVASAWILALLSAICWQLVSGFLYDFLHVRAGLQSPQAGQAKEIEHYYTGQLIVLIFFYTSLYLVKFSFLLFFKRLGRNVQNQRYLWWPICVLAVSSYIVSIGTISFKCLTGSFSVILEECFTHKTIMFIAVTFKINTALDVVTDFSIMLLPFTMLWNVQMKWQRKVALMGVFSLVIITIAFAITRVTVTCKYSGQHEVSWMYMWTSIEQNIAIIVCSITAFPNVFHRSKESQASSQIPNTYLGSKMKRLTSNSSPPKSSDPRSKDLNFRDGSEDLRNPSLDVVGRSFDFGVVTSEITNPGAQEDLGVMTICESENRRVMRYNPETAQYDYTRPPPPTFRPQTSL